MNRERKTLMESITIDIKRPDMLAHIDNDTMCILVLFTYGITSFIINNREIGLQLYRIDIASNKLFFYNRQLKILQRRFRELKLRKLYLNKYLRQREIGLRIPHRP